MPMRGVCTTAPGAGPRACSSTRPAPIGSPSSVGADRERLAEAPGAAAELEQRLAPAPLAHLLEARRRLERADQHGLAAPSCAPQTMLSIQWMP